MFPVPAGIPDTLDRHRPVVILDIFRATTTMTAALATGAKEILIGTNDDEVHRLAENFPPQAALLCGERDGRILPGYDLDNSPCDMEKEPLAGKTIILNSTNGSKLLDRFGAFDYVAAGSCVSLSRTVAFISTFDEDPIIVCSGRIGYLSHEDTLIAGKIVLALGRKDDDLDDAAAFAAQFARAHKDGWRELAKNSFHGRYLASLGKGADLDYCLTVDKFDFVPVKTGNSFVKG